MDLDGLGIWSGALRHRDPSERAEAVAELDELGYSALWLPTFYGEPAHEPLDAILAAGRTIRVATGIISIWHYEPDTLAELADRLERDHPGRFLLGLGVSHAVVVDQLPDERYAKPLTQMRRTLDALDAAPTPVPHDRIVLAALKPKMTALAGERTRGSHPYLVTPEHTAGARAILGAGPLLAPEQAAVLERDPETARAIARDHLAFYLTLPNYVNAWRDLGFGEDAFADGGSDALVDALVAWGDEDAIAARVRAHRDAGADHVCLQVLGAGDDLPRDQWRRLAALA